MDNGWNEHMKDFAKKAFKKAAENKKTDSTTKHSKGSNYDPAKEQKLAADAAKAEAERKTASLKAADAKIKHQFYKASSKK